MIRKVLEDWDVGCVIPLGRESSRNLWPNYLTLILIATQVNLLVALEAVEDAVAAGDPRRVVVALNGVPGMRAPVRAASASAYLAELSMAVQSLDEEFLRTEMIEEIVSRVNKLGKRRSLTVTDPKIIAVKGVNDALRSDMFPGTKAKTCSKQKNLLSNLKLY